MVTVAVCLTANKGLQKSIALSSLKERRNSYEAKKAFIESIIRFCNGCSASLIQDVLYCDECQALVEKGWLAKS